MWHRTVPYGPVQYLVRPTYSAFALQVRILNANTEYIASLYAALSPVGPGFMHNKDIVFYTIMLTSRIKLSSTVVQCVYLYFTSNNLHIYYPAYNINRIVH